MTWLKLGEEFVLEVAAFELSDAAFRTHVEGLAYALYKENDGIFADREVARFAESADAKAGVQELIDKGLWQRRTGGKLQIIHHMAEQPTAEYLRDKRLGAANRQRRFREVAALEAQGLTPEEIESVLKERGIPLPATSAKKRRGEASSPPVTRDKTRDVTRDSTRDPERSGTEQSGTERSSKEALDEGVLVTSSAGSPSGSSSALVPPHQGWLNGDAAPIGGDPSKCTSPSCGGRVTEYNRSQGIRKCNDCLSRLA